LVSLMGTLLLASGIAYAQGTADGVPGSVSPAAARWLTTKSSIEAVRLLEEPAGAPIKVAVLTGREKFGWQIVVLSRDWRERYEPFWKTTRLPSSFEVSQGGSLQTLHVNGEQVISFQGCQPHRCPEVFSALLFVPSQKKEFTATCHDGKTVYSFDEESRTQEYRYALDRLLQSQSGSATACAKKPNPR
jgi:hypothetical protein